MAKRQDQVVAGKMKQMFRRSTIASSKLALAEEDRDRPTLVFEYILLIRNHADRCCFQGGSG
jgi:hypothetical protein